MEKKFIENKTIYEIPSLSLNSKLVLLEALKRGIKVEYVDGTDYYLLSNKNDVKTLRASLNCMGFSSHAMKILSEKHQTKAFLGRADICVPKGVKLNVDDKKQIVETFNGLKKPLVVKPAASSYGGECVFLNIINISDLIKKIKKCARSGHKSIVIEEQFNGGVEYRILATKDEVVAISCRRPANVIGDGKHSIAGLVDIKNADERRGGHDYKKPLIKIEIDNFVKAFLKKQNLYLKSVPPKGQQIFLRENSNLSTGGDSIDCTDIAHKSIKEIAKKAINSIPELPYSGIDLMTKDITKPQTKDSYVIIEMNASPMISMHHFPCEGKPRDVAKAIVDVAFPETKRL